MQENVFEDVSSVAQVSSSDKQLGITATDLVRNWGIGLEAAKQTIKSTTQRAIRSVA